MLHLKVQPLFSDSEGVSQLGQNWLLTRISARRSLSATTFEESNCLSINFLLLVAVAFLNDCIVLLFLIVIERPDGAVGTAIAVAENEQSVSNNTTIHFHLFKE